MLLPCVTIVLVGDDVQCITLNGIPYVYVENAC